MSKWFIVIIVLFMLLALFLGFHMNKQRQSSLFVSTIKPSGKIHLQKIEVKMDINDILTHKPTKDGNAADLYIQALTVMTSSIFLAGYIPTTTQVNYSTIPELALIEKAALMKDCHFSPKYSSSMLTYDDFTTPNFGPFNPPPGKFPNLIKLLLAKGSQYEKERKMDNAVSEYESVILFCYRIIKNNMNSGDSMWSYPFEKMAIMRLQGGYLSQGNSAMVAACQKYLDETIDALNAINQKVKVFSLPYPTNSSSSTGSFFTVFQSANLPVDSMDEPIEIALFDQDPLWRRGTILYLGIHRFDKFNNIFGIKSDAPYKGRIELVLDYICTHDSDSTIRLAADNALKLKDYKP